MANDYSETQGNTGRLAFEGTIRNLSSTQMELKNGTTVTVPADVTLDSDMIAWVDDLIVLASKDSRGGGKGNGGSGCTEIKTPDGWVITVCAPPKIVAG
jgi:hypothetical protein